MYRQGNESIRMESWELTPGRRSTLLGSPWFLACFASVVMLTAGWLVSRIPPRYRAVATVQCIQKDSTEIATLPQAEQLQELVLDEQVLKPALWKILRPSYEPDWSQYLPTVVRHFAVQTRQERPDSYAIHIGFDYKDPVYARGVALETAKSFVELMKQTDSSRRQQELVAAKAEQYKSAEQNWLSSWNQLKQLNAHPRLVALKDADDQLQSVEERLAEAVRRRDALLREQVPADDLPTAPALQRRDNLPPATMAEDALQINLKRRAEIAAIYSEQHPLVVNLDEKIRHLAELAGIDDLSSIAGIRQVAFQSEDNSQDGEIDQVNRELATLEERQNLLRKQLQLKAALERQLNEQRAQVEQLHQAKTRLQSELATAEDQLRALEASNPIRYEFSENDAVSLQFVGLDRRRWFAGIAGATLLITMGCWWLGRR